MPRLEFSDVTEFGKWLNKQVINYKKPYKVYITDTEVIAIPATSTRPHEYGYTRFNTKEQIKSLIELFDTLGLDVFRISRITWNPESEPRVGEE